jgi:uncharacterized protein (DUF2141 family)
MNARLLLPLGLPLLLANTAPGNLDVTVSGIKNTRGALLVCLWKDKTGFPTCGKSKSAVRLRSPVSGSTMKVTFRNVAPGSYAVSVEHDEDGDGKLKTNFIGMPKEGVGVSNNPGGIPSFGKAQVRVNGNGAIAITIRYL